MTGPTFTSPPSSIPVVAAVMERNGRFLVGRRPEHKRHGGLWEFPGGKVAPGESWLDAARRELDEELGMRAVAVGRILVRVQDPKSPFVIHFVEVAARGEPVPTEHTEVGWYTAEELAALPLAPADAQFVAGLSRDDFDAKASTWDQDPVRRERAAAVAGQIRERIPVTRESHVLDFGSGTGLLGFHFLEHASSVTFADTSEGMLTQVEEKLSAGGHTRGRTVRLDPATGAFPGRYGAIVSLMTLHHVPDPTATLALLAEHLEPDGWLAVCDLDTEDGTFHDDPRARVHHGFDRRWLVDTAERLGLDRVETSTPWVMHREGPAGIRDYPLFLLTARRPPTP